MDDTLLPGTASSRRSRNFRAWKEMVLEKLRLSFFKYTGKCLTGIPLCMQNGTQSGLFFVCVHLFNLQHNLKENLKASPDNKRIVVHRMGWQ